MQRIKVKIPKKKYEPEEHVEEGNQGGGGLPQIQYDEFGDPISTPECPVDVESFKRAKIENARIKAETEAHMARMIMWATPMALRVRGRKNNEAVLYLASLTFLCVDGMNNFVTITRNFALENALEGEELKNLDLHFDNLTTNVKICVDQIINRCPCYVTEMDFQIDKVDTKVVNLPCYDSKTGEEKIYEITVDAYMGMKYIEEMVYRCAVGEDAFFNFATLIASKGEFSTGFFDIQEIDKVIAITSGKRRARGIIGFFKNLFSIDRGTSQLAVVIRGRRRPPKPAPHYNTIPTDTEEEKAAKIAKAEIEAQKEWDAMEDEEVCLMMPYDTDGVLYKKDKFKGMTIEVMENAYYGKEDQYSTTLTNYDCIVGGKSYTAMRGKNKEGDVKIFLMDDDVMAKLNKLIEEY